MMEYPILQFSPFSSVLDPGFWYQLTKRKLDVYKLDDQPVKIGGWYTNGEAPGLVPLANVDYTAFDDNYQVPPKSFLISGILYNTNTIEEFKQKDKTDLIEKTGKKIWDDIVSGEVFKDPSLLSCFLCLTHADLKKYHFYYWFAFPALRYPESSYIIDKPLMLDKYFTVQQIEQLEEGIKKLFCQAYFLVHIAIDGKISVIHLRDYHSVNTQPGKVLLAFADPSTFNCYPGWPLRNLLALVAYHWGKDKKEWEILCFRDRLKSCIHSLVLKIQLGSFDLPQSSPPCVGWEKNAQQKVGPRKVDLSASLDPVKLAKSAVDLNLKLMRWRLVPDLELDEVMSTKCLLLGSGTLGCNVARCLLGWGIRTITMVDNSQVSYSNPVRQSLFTFQDCLNGGRRKAEAASEALLSIFPGVNSEGVHLTIPMPGHPIAEKLINQIKLDVEKLEDLIENHDVIFLLMDTRESRWLPTVIASAKKKLVINAALGFDTYLVLRHGIKIDNCPTSSPKLGESIPGNQLGCYFCNDVVAPGDSTRDRTLDQQCTVTRPGVSMMAAALAVELMINVIQHPQRGLAPADTSARDDHLKVEIASPLGIVPHQIRGFLARCHQILPASVAFHYCTACSSQIINKYKTEGFDFLLQAFNNPNYIEELTGLKQLQQETEEVEIWELSDDESVGGTSGSDKGEPH